MFTFIERTVFVVSNASKSRVSARNGREGGRVLDTFSVALGRFGIANAIEPLLVESSAIQEC